MTLLKENIQEQILKLFWSQDDYRDFFKILNDSKLCSKLNSKTKMACCLEISVTYVSKVLAKKGHFSPEHLVTLSKSLKFNENETLALIDKALIAKTESPELRHAAQLRLKQSFDFIHSSQSDSELGTGLSSMNHPIYWRIKNCLYQHSQLTLTEISLHTNIQEKRLRFLLDHLIQNKHILSISTLEGTQYKLKSAKNTFRLLGAHSADLRETGQLVRNMAQISLAQRYPINIVEGSEHYISGGYLMALTGDEIQELQILFTNAMKRIEQLNLNKKETQNTKLVGLCFDFFDIP